MKSLFKYTVQEDELEVLKAHYQAIVHCLEHKELYTGTEVTLSGKTRFNWLTMENEPTYIVKYIPRLPTPEGMVLEEYSDEFAMNYGVKGAIVACSSHPYKEFKTLVTTSKPGDEIFCGCKLKQFIHTILSLNSKGV